MNTENNLFEFVKPSRQKKAKALVRKSDVKRMKAAKGYNRQEFKREMRCG